MKISYKVLQKYIPDLETPEILAEKLIMHTAEVEEVHYEGADFENIVYGKIKTVTAHENADALRVCMVDVGENQDVQIVCGGSNLKVGQAVAVAKIGAVVSWHGKETVTMKKTAIRGVESFGMICASEEIGLLNEFPQKSETEILDLSHISAQAGTPLAELLGKNDAILEVDNKAINHRPDLFSHIGVAREICAINGKKLDFEYPKNDFSGLDTFLLENQIPDVVSRYMAIKMENVENIASPEYMLHALGSSDVASKGLLVDISNYSLYLLGQPIHCFDADTISGKIIVRYAKDGETFEALNDKNYELNTTDIIIADEEKVLALAGIIGGKSSSVTDSTKNIVIESAHFDQATLRKTGKRLGIRTDALNVFEKDIVNEMQLYGASLVVNELQSLLPNAQVTAFADSYTKKQAVITIPYDRGFFNRLIGKEYSQTQLEELFENLGITKNGDTLTVPFWRKDLYYKADITEEIARIFGYNDVESTVPEINLGAVTQRPMYFLKQETRNFLTAIGFYDMYTYSFVDERLMQSCRGTVENLVAMKNPLTEEMTHLRGSLIPNLLQSLEKNRKLETNLQLFELEKVYKKENNRASENYALSGVISSQQEIPYYQAQQVIEKLFHTLGIQKYFFETTNTAPSYAHTGRTAEVRLRGKVVGYVGEVSPKVVHNFNLEGKVAFFELNADLLAEAIHTKVQAKEVSTFQENNFDLNFVVDKNTEAKNIKTNIEKADNKLIQRVQLIDIYENEEKLPGKRSLTYKVFIQSMDGTLDDKVKAELIEKIVKRVEKVGGELR